jgi:two-component system chemotaxis response regulator CheB
MSSPAPAVPAAEQHVLIVDDSAVARAVLSRVINGCPGFAVNGTVPTAAMALRFLAANTVDFILLDIQMPGVDGITALPDLAAAAPHAKIIVVSSMAAAGVQALALGAADTLTKPAPGELSGPFAKALSDTLIRLQGATGTPIVAPVPFPSTVTPPMSPDKLQKRQGGDDFDVVAIGASTGGIHALSGMLRELPVDFRLPVLVTQHLPPSFMPYFAAQLAVLAGRPCDVATDRLRIRPGRLIVAPGDAHITCAALPDGGAAIRLSHDAAPSGCTPSVDPMLASAAQVFGNRVLAVVLSGMGRDGSDGARRVSEAGGCVVIQDSATSVVWGMPGAVAAQGIADAVLPPDAIGRLTASRRRP